MDIETIKIGKELHPYLICGYNKENFIYSFAKDLEPESTKEMFNNFINKLTQIKSVKYVYAHNLSGFDGVFLLKHLMTFKASNAIPLLHNSKLIAVQFKQRTKNKTRSIIFKDSYLLLPLSLRKLCEERQLKHL